MMLNLKGSNPLNLAERNQMELNFGETLRVRRDQASKTGLHTQSRFPVREKNFLEKKLIGSPYRKTPTCCG